MIPQTRYNQNFAVPKLYLYPHYFDLFLLYYQHFKGFKALLVPPYFKEKNHYINVLNIFKGNEGATEPLAPPVGTPREKHLN